MFDQIFTEKLLTLLGITPEDCLISRSSSGNLMIQSQTGEQELYLRPFPAHTLTIARIQVAEPRQGIGSQLLDYLKQWSLQKELKHIVFEQVMTESMTAFAQKHQFQRVEDRGFWVNEQWIGNYQLTLSELI